MNLENGIVVEDNRQSNEQEPPAKHDGSIIPAERFLQPLCTIVDGSYFVHHLLFMESVSEVEENKYLQEWKCEGVDNR